MGRKKVYSFIYFFIFTFGFFQRSHVDMQKHTLKYLLKVSHEPTMEGGRCVGFRLRSSLAGVSRHK